MLNSIKKINRSLLVIFSFVFFGLGALITGYIIFPVIKSIYKKNENLKLKYNIVLQKSWYFFVLLLQKLKIIAIKSNDIEKLKNIKNSIIVSTHPSYIDILILISIIPHSTCFVAERIIKNPFFKQIAKELFIIQGQPADMWLDDAKKMLDNGFNIIIFPMGTRHKNNEYPKIRRGAAMLAQNTGKNIVILDMRTNFEFLQINEPVYKAGSGTVVYSIFYLDEVDIKDWLNEYTDEVSLKTELTKYITKTLYRDKINIL